MKAENTIRREIKNIEDTILIRQLSDKQVKNLEAARFALQWALGKFARTAQPHAAYCDWKELCLMRTLRR